LHQLLIASRAHPELPVTAALECLVAALGDSAGLSYAVRAELYGAASRQGYGAIARMIVDGASDLSTAAAAAERPLTPRGRPLTLGERKALARGPVRQTLEHLLRDPHPDVVGILLNNPHLTERDVLAIATRRPNAASVLQEVAKSPRWTRRYPVKRALVLNPHTPPQVAVRLASLLTSQDLQLVRGESYLHPELCCHAAELLQLAAP
jgi:hypothetical protein